MNKPDTISHLDTGIFTALVAGDLKGKQKRQAEAHLLVCPDCTREYEAITQLWATAKASATAGNADVVRQSLVSHIAARSERKFMFQLVFTLPRLSVGVVGAIGVAAALWLTPGAPLHPLPVFAEVEKAMMQVNTATWNEITYKGGTKQSPQAESSRCEMQRRPEPLVVRRTTSKIGTKQHDFVQITNRWGCFTPRNGSYIIWERGNQVESQIQEMLYFPSLPSTQHQWEGEQEYRTRWGWQWTRGAWKRESTTLDNRSVLRFSARDQQWRNADRNHSQGRIINKTVWVDPETFRIVRSENQYNNGTRQWLTVREKFQYNLPSAEPMNGQLPPIGKKISITDTSLIAPDAPQVPASEVAEVKALLNHVGAQWNKPEPLAPDWLDSEIQGRALTFVPDPPKPKSRLVELSEKPGKKSKMQKFTVTQVVEVRYNPYTYRRERSDEAFPPALKDTAYHVIASVSGISAAGKPVACPALFSLRRINGRLRFTLAGFFPDSPAAAAQSWTRKAMSKR